MRMLLQMLFSNPLVFFLVAGALIISISIHEFAHAYASHKLGDDTAKYLGRVTLNPLSHLDPIGTLLLLVAGFGWGRPVPFNPYNLANPKRDSAIISLAGPVSNFLLALVLTIFFHIFSFVPIINTFLYLTILYNIMLGIFNLIPVHPLDGFKVVNGILPHNLSVQWLQMAPYGIFILIFLVMTDAVSQIVSPVIEIILRLLGLSSF